MKYLSPWLIWAAACFLATLSLRASDIEDIQQAQNKLNVLEGHGDDHVDYRIPPKLTPGQVLERQRLIGFLFTEDPYWRLEMELALQISSLHSIENSDQKLNVKVNLLKEALVTCVSLAALPQSNKAQLDTMFIRKSILCSDLESLHVYYRKRHAEQDAAANP